MSSALGTGAVITGVGLISACGPEGITTFDDLLRGDGPRVRASTPWRPGAGTIDLAHVDAGLVAGTLPPQRLRTLPAEAALLQAAARHALAGARLDVSAADSGRIGVSVSTQYSGLQDYAEILQRAADDGGLPVSPTRGSQTGFNAPAGQLSIRLGMTGPNATLIGGATGGLDALLYATDELAAGHADVMLVGGVDVVPPAAVPALDKAARWPPRPFDRERRGPAYGSVAAVLVVETSDIASRRGADVIGRVMSASTTYSPAGDLADASERALRNTLSLAQTGPAAIAACFAGANGSVLGDGVERRALHRVLGGEIPVYAVKGQIGECAGAAAVAQLAVATLSLQRGCLPGTAGFRTHDDRHDALNVTDQPAALRPGPVIVHAWDEDGAAGAAVIAHGDGPSSGSR